MIPASVAWGGTGRMLQYGASASPVYTIVLKRGTKNFASSFESRRKFRFVRDTGRDSGDREGNMEPPASPILCSHANRDSVQSESRNPLSFLTARQPVQVRIRPEEEQASEDG